MSDLPTGIALRLLRPRTLGDLRAWTTLVERIGLTDAALLTMCDDRLGSTPFVSAYLPLDDLDVEVWDQP